MPQGHMHVGILYRERDGDSRVRLLHLAFHKSLQDDAVNSRIYCQKLRRSLVCIIPALEEEDAINVAIYCRGIARHLPAVPYGLSYNEDGCFVITEGRAELKLPEDRRWLNCSTFVLTVFQSAGPRLIDPIGWPDRPDEDRVMQRQLIHWLWPAAGCKHIKRQLSAIGRARVRPEETAGACLEDILPARFGECEPNGKFVLALLDGEVTLTNR
jgi:hypothetical protein